MSDSDSQLIPYAPHITRLTLQMVQMWAEAQTNPDSRRFHDLVRDKMVTLLGDGDGGTAAGFFIHIKKPVDQINPQDIKDYQAYLEQMHLASGSIYGRISRISSFYKWLMKEPYFQGRINTNPVNMARPQAPKPYQSNKTQSLSDDDARALLQVVENHAEKGDIHAIRDYALLRFYFATGKRRSEIIYLEWGDIRFTRDSIIINTEEKGGLYRATEINDEGVYESLVDYLIASSRWDTVRDRPLIKPDDPLWLRHDRAAKGQQQVTSHGFVKSLKRYAQEAGIGHIHLHQTRHTVARLVGEEAGDLAEVQTILGHQNIATTRVYLQRVQIKRDKHSRKIASRLGLNNPKRKSE